MDLEMMRNWTKNNDKIKILGSSECLLKFQGIPLLKAIAASMADTFLGGNSPLTTKKTNIIKYHLCGPWNDDKVGKNDNKIHNIG